jgi:hypothetical protein
MATRVSQAVADRVREIYVLNDSSLHHEQLNSGLSVRAYVQRNRADIDRRVKDQIFQESPAKKAVWLEGAKKRFPLGANVIVREYDEESYVGLRGKVIGYDLGVNGEWPLVSVGFDDGQRDGFYGDGAKDDQIQRVAVKRVAQRRTR